MSQYNASVGRRKRASVSIKLTHGGTGNIMVSHHGKMQTLKEYFGGRVYLIEQIMTPFKLIGGDIHKNYDAIVSLAGGGVAGQAGAMRLGFAKALSESNPEWRTLLKPYGMFQRDARIKERKKPGLKKARKAPTWSKR